MVGSRHRKIKVVVLMGGRSPEHEISLISGKEVIKNLDHKKYNAFPLVISKTGKGFGKLFRINPDIVFIAMHGPFGEDGRIQGMLETLGFKYTGSGVLASALGMDKLTFRKFMERELFPIPKYVVVRKGEKLSNLEKVLGKPPYVVKPSAQGSSVGVSIVKNSVALYKALKLAFKYGKETIVDEYIKGLEVTCAVLGNDKPFALPVVEIKPKGKFFDYDSKYMPGGSEEIVPARISKSLTRKVQEISLNVYKLIGAKGFARIDFILKADKYPCVLEINTIPGLTPMSLLPKAAKAAGISYPKLLEKIIDYAL